jgi:hypothetical protein
MKCPQRRFSCINLSSGSQSEISGLACENYQRNVAFLGGPLIFSELKKAFMTLNLEGDAIISPENYIY